MKDELLDKNILTEGGLIDLEKINSTEIMMDVMASKSPCMMTMESMIALSSSFSSLDILRKQFCLLRNNLLKMYDNPTTYDIPDFESDSFQEVKDNEIYCNYYSYCVHSGHKQQVCYIEPDFSQSTCIRKINFMEPESIANGGLSIEFYYGRRHQAVMEAANASEAVQAVVSYCLEHYGLPSFGAGGSLELVQSRVSGGGYATTGASLLDEPDFTAANLSDTGKGAVPGEVMIHELVHQWWGLGCMFDASDPEDTWSAEGLTVYTTWRIVKELYGEAYAREHYVKQWQEAVEDYYLDFYVRNPEYLDMLPEEKKLLITEDLAYVRRYCEMPLKILKAETLVGGEAAMDQILFRLFNREPDPMAPYLTYEEFLDACGLREEDLNLA